MFTVEGRRRRKDWVGVRSPVWLLVGVRVVTDAFVLRLTLSRLLLLLLRTSSSIESVRNMIAPPPFSQ